ncbi:hypothetical protein N7462_005952 [Penicillium macrosclerotiorum]|uniref:uncharacterized protein n=1 Tax=Penicillium macrosclerotiorum TaxID=303699 RepID=UPI002546AD61|nr:uncharacterized protein N7462_005952 [Penicillium macrosclerotiorum]KAJ5682787.1 hypothetical protein N7462_005952 [Penicillium macrosclerotiorum]
MPFLEKTCPPPLWSSFPTSRLSSHQTRESARAITPGCPSAPPSPPAAIPTIITPTMGNSQSKPPRRHSSFLGSIRRSLSRSSTKSTKSSKSSKRASGISLWDPPAYDSLHWTAPNTSDGSLGENDSRYAFLKDFDTIFLVDDSSSMSGARWREAEAAIAAIAPICTQHDADGIDIYFLNHRRAGMDTQTGAYKNVTTAATVQNIFRSVMPRGSTPVGRRLLEILTPYLRRVERMQAAAEYPLPDPSMYVKPVNIIVITDGEFTDDAESVIVQVARQLDGPRCAALPWQVGIQLFQIGDDEDVRRYLQELDDDLGKWCQDEKMRDIVDTVPWQGKFGGGLDADGILKCVLGAVNKKYDRRRI